VASFTYTKNYDDNTTLTEAHLDAAFDSVATFLNSTKINDDNLQTGGVGTTSIANGAITAAKLGSSAVETAKINDAAVTTAKILDSNVTLAKLAAAVAAALVPTGAVLSYGGTSAPTGYLLCDGTAVNRTTYADLFAVIGEFHGQGDNVTTFNVPDYRGRFLRGVDASQGRDPNAATRTAMATGGNTGDNVGSLQGDDYKAHTHTIANVLVAGSTEPYNAGTGADFHMNNSGATGTSPTSGGSETRPKNAYVTYIIKT
jgi:microcystin-dependent protein